MTTDVLPDNLAPTEDGGSAPPEDPAARRQVLTLLASIFIVAGCGLVYELLIATVSTYLLGSSVTQFSVCIGLFIGSMGLGSHLSQRVGGDLLAWFIGIEIALGGLGGLSVLLLFQTYATGALYWVALYGLLVVIGTLVGLELPILTRLLRRYGTLRKTIAQALSFDYVGALAGSLLLPLLLLPTLGMARSAVLVGLVNAATAGWNLWVFRDELRARAARWRAMVAACGASVVALVAAFAFSVALLGVAESRLYADQVIYAAQTPYQRIVITRWRDDTRLFLDGHLQFASIDEYRYHEALVHPAMSLAPVAENVLVLGGGDGLAVRELLKYPGLKRVTLVDLDPKMTELGRTYPPVVALNGNALADPRVAVVNRDAHKFLEETSELFDVIVADLPDPNNEVLAKLYSTEFYALAGRHLSASGVFVTQSTSPFFARDAFWCIRRTVAAANLEAVPYHAYVPSFGDWGFVLAGRHAIRPERLAQLEMKVPTRFLTPESAKQMFVFSKDQGEPTPPPEVSTLDRPTVLRYYVDDWRQWARGGS